MIVARRIEKTKSVNTRKLRCPVCSQGRLCDVIRKRNHTMSDALETQTKILIKCPICNSNIGIALK